MRSFIYTLIFVFISASSLLAARDYPQIKNGTIVTDHGDLLRGCHSHIMTNFLTKYKEILWWKALRDSAHFNVVRMMAYNSPTWYNGGGEKMETNMLGSRLDIAVENSGKAGMYLIIDDHSFCCGGDMMPVDSAKMQYGINFWKYVAERYGKYPHVIFELKNEPPDNFISGNLWTEHTKNLYKIIRSFSPNNFVITHTPGAENDNELSGAVAKCGTGKDTILYNPNSGRNLLAWHGYGTGDLNSSGTDLKGPYVWEVQKKAAVICDEFGDDKHDAAYKLAQFLEKRKVSWVWLMKTGFNWEAYPPTWPKDPYAVDMSGPSVNIASTSRQPSRFQSTHQTCMLHNELVRQIARGTINPDNVDFFTPGGKRIPTKSLLCKSSHAQLSTIIIRNKSAAR